MIYIQSNVLFHCTVRWFLTNVYTCITIKIKIFNVSFSNNMFPSAPYSLSWPHPSGPRPLLYSFHCKSVLPFLESHVKRITQYLRCIFYVEKYQDARLDVVAPAFNPSTLGGQGRWITRSRNRDHPGKHSETPSLLKFFKNLLINLAVLLLKFILKLWP